jgi:signal peptidase I
MMVAIFGGHMNRGKTIGLLVVAVGLVSALVVLIVVAASEVELVTYGTKDMEPTIAQNETIFVFRRVEDIKRGDIVIFKYPGDHSQSFVKRVVGLPGERLAIREGRLFIGGQPLEESYLHGRVSSIARSFPESEIPPASYYVLGDNRDASNDSRMWGPLSADFIYGKVLFK